MQTVQIVFLARLLQRVAVKADLMVVSRRALAVAVAVVAVTVLVMQARQGQADKVLQAVQVKAIWQPMALRVAVAVQQVQVLIQHLVQAAQAVVAQRAVIAVRQ